MALILPEYLQTKKYSAQRVRALLMDLGVVQEGVVNANDWKVSQRAAGANKSVDIATGVGWIKGKTSARQGLYHAYNDAIVNLTIPDNASGNPRIDQIVVTVNDTTDGGAVSDNAVYQVIQGTPTAGATLDNRNGAVATGSLPASSLRIADIVVANGFTSIVTANIRDRRLWANGINWAVNGSFGGNYTGTSTTYTDVLAFTPVRLECSGSPLYITFSGRAWCTTAGQSAFFALFVDGASSGVQRTITSPAANEADAFQFEFAMIPTAGSHLFQINPAVSSGSWVLENSSSAIPFFKIQEDLRSSTGRNNGTT